MKSIKLLIVYLFTISLIYGQTENPSFVPNGRVKYYQDFLNFAGEKQTRLDIFIQVPFKEIQFVKSSKGFEGGYSVTVSIYEEDKETLVLEKLWNEKITVATFEELSSKENFNLSYRSFELEPKRYFIKTTVIDKDSRQEYFSSNLFDVKDFSLKPSISDIILIANQTIVDGSSKIIPNVSRNVSGSEGGINIFFEIYSDSTAENDVEYIITNDKKEVVISKTEKQLLNKGKTQVIYTVNDTTLSLGKYLLSIIIKDSSGNLIATTTKPFFSRLVGLPSSVNDIDKAISQLIYIATPDELEFIEEGKTEEEKTKRFMEFWKSKDPSPGNEENEVFEEYFRRIGYANENFSSYNEGWRTDRGMVFIILGTPNNVDRHPFEYDSKPYEVWQYYELNRSFVFVDETGFGDYRLITPMYGDLFRYRY